MSTTLSEPEKHLLALWGAEAAKAWWLELTEEKRAELATMPVDAMFKMGWQAAMSRAAKEEDTRRLGFIEANRWGVWFNDRADGFIVQSRNQIAGNIGKGRTVREAIDQAINR
jgi:hypothetical protein